MGIEKILQNLPEVKHPTEKKLSFNVKLKWTLIIISAFFILANIPLYGLTADNLSRYKTIAMLLGAEFGSLISLGVGPIVMASIILQLLAGSGILRIDTTTKEGKRYFQGLQKIGVFAFIIFESLVYVLMGGLQAVPGLTGVLVFQLVLGGIAIMFMDEVSTKWGFGSGVSLFIVAGVAWRLFTGLFQFVNLGPSGSPTLCFSDSTGSCAGAVWIVIQSFINGLPSEALVALATILVTIGVFLVVIWAQSLKVEIPLSFDRIRGYSMKWPLPFFYTSNIPVILAAALVANVQLAGSLFETWMGHSTWLGGFSNGQPISGFAFWLGNTNIVEAIIRDSLQATHIIQAITHLIFYAAFSTIFAVIWVKTANIDASAQAKRIIASGLQIPGFRKDERVLESILERYVLPLTIMGGLAVGILAAITDTLGALTSGTGILLAVMITYQFYQNIAQQHAYDMHPALKKLTG